VLGFDVAAGLAADHFRYGALPPLGGGDSTVSASKSPECQAHLAEDLVDLEALL